MSAKHYDRLQRDYSALADVDFHHKITKCAGHRKSCENHQKLGICRTQCKEDELVRYMSNLPGYLEKGESINDKALNVGVLDWACLEQWKCSHEHMPHISSRSSTSTSNTCMSDSMDISPGYSARGRSLSPSCQRIFCPPRPCHFMASAIQCRSQDAKSLEIKLENCQNISGCNNSTHGQFVRVSDHLFENFPDNKLKARNMKDLDPKIGMKRGDQMYEVASYIQLQMSTQDGKLERNVETFQQPNVVTVEKDVLRKNSSIGTERIKAHTATISAPLSAKMVGIRPFKSRQAEKKQPTTTMLFARESSHEPAQNVTGEKSRSSSPFRWFSFSTGLARKGSGCKEDALQPHRSSIGTATSCLENMRDSSSSDILGNGKAGEACRSRSSPLRRLLDPLLKPKTVNCHHPAESSQKDSLLISSSMQREKGLIRDLRVGHNTFDKDDSLKNKKHVSSTYQALLRIAWKNGLPTFTFAVDKSSSILAATVKKSCTTEKDGCCCIYTFFTFRDVNRKGGNWIKQAGKGKGPDYTHHVVAQMKVSSPRYLELTGQNCVDSSNLKEFVLYSVKLKQGCDQALEYQLDDELAAIILKIPKTKSFIDNEHYSSSHDHPQEMVRATVVFPSGVHSHPSKGGPSSLIERWKSGGSCDCGGWDMSCKLKIFANENPAGKKSVPSKACCEDYFELFLQGNGQEHRPAFGLVPFKQGIFSVFYDSSFTLVQAFSICIALVDCRMPCELYGSRNSEEEKTPRVGINGIKAFNN